MSRARARPRAARGRSLVGQRFSIRAERVGHGGFVVGRHEGRAVFVRHTLPGELVVAEVTEGSEGDRFLRADAVEVLEASPHRVGAPCPFAGPGRCGGCDWQHAEVPYQRVLKAAVVAEQLQRLAGLSVEVVVEPVEPDALGWRTRVQWAVAGGTTGLRKHRSHEVVAVDRCRIAHRDIDEAPAPAGPAVETIVSGTGERLTLVSSADGTTYADGPVVLHERALDRTWQVTGSGFWQVHPEAAESLVGAVLEGLEPRPGERCVDLYSGVGLFSGALARLVGPRGSVAAVEGDRTASTDAEANLADLPWVSAVADRVDRALRTGACGDAADLVVLDPPRTGAKRDVVEAVVRLGPRAVGYVACDPAALARDVAIFAEHNYALRSLRAFDLFPMTHHVECVAVLAPGAEATGAR